MLPGLLTSEGENLLGESHLSKQRQLGATDTLLNDEDFLHVTIYFSFDFFFFLQTYKIVKIIHSWQLSTNRSSSVHGP